MSVSRVPKAPLNIFKAFFKCRMVSMSCSEGLKILAMLSKRGDVLAMSNFESFQLRSMLICRVAHNLF
eukprot:CAMPEP_0180814824 /NCGR_PEP_ID=MMETSP1038_2-20121128/67275_1 /TAXON_ID=632150 /ORGANISM="Azadinium spinosum, Strain 3D9" /LENGTH=67 /DNA_ID=CAMNT_0022856509 /DNA_START=996 /DNA_END=1199 /DNA_ORIENTATION=-